MHACLFQAETWLNVQAQAQGWAKAAKVQSRSTPNGLIGVVLKNNSAVMVCRLIIIKLVLISDSSHVLFKGGDKL